MSYSNYSIDEIPHMLKLILAEIADADSKTEKIYCNISLFELLLSPNGKLYLFNIDDGCYRLRKTLLFKIKELLQDEDVNDCLILLNMLTHYHNLIVEYDRFY